jgi:peptide/nickel transport system substrate-binding protein
MGQNNLKIHFSNKREPCCILLIILMLAVLAISGCDLVNNTGDVGLAPTATDGQISQNSATLTPILRSNKSSESTPTPIQEIPFEPLSASAKNCDYGGEFESIQAVDANTVRFMLCRPDPAFLAKIAFPSFGIVPAARIEQTGGGGKGSPLLLEPIGTGPYRFNQWQAGTLISFSYFKDYWDGQGQHTPNLNFRWNLDDSQRLLELQTGTVQAIDNPNPQDLNTIQADPGLILLARPPLSVAFVGMNNTYPPLDNQLVRQAISMGIDREVILDQFFPPGFELANYFTPCIIPNGCVGEPWYSYDPEAAKNLLMEAGYPDGFQTQISYRNVVRGYLPQPAAVAAAIQSQLQQNLKISARLVPIDSPEFLNAADEGLLPGLFLLGWGADYPDVSNFLDTHFGILATKMLGNPFDDILALLKKGAAVADESSRRPIYEAANNAIRQHTPIVPLAHGGWVFPQTLQVAFNKSVQGAYASPFGFENFSEMYSTRGDTLVWMQSQEPLSLYCADETDSDTLRACTQVIETLYRFQDGSTNVEPALAKICAPNEDLKIWTCTLRSDVKFHDGTTMNANDVVISFLVQWDAASPYHKGRTGEFAYFKNFWGPFLNTPTP